MVKWEDCLPGAWIEIYDESWIKIVNRSAVPGYAMSDMFEIQYETDSMFLETLTSRNIEKVLTKEEHPELYL